MGRSHFFSTSFSIQRHLADDHHSLPVAVTQKIRQTSNFGVLLQSAYLCGKLVGAERFELPTLCSQSRCATRLRHAPIQYFLPHEVLTRAGARGERIIRPVPGPVNLIRLFFSNKRRTGKSDPNNASARPAALLLCALVEPSASRQP